MADFITTLRGMPQMQAITPETTAGLVEDAVSYLYGVHRWPFMKEADVELVWTANVAQKSFPGLARITTLRYPDTPTQYRPLKMRSDADFARWKYNNHGSTQVSVWREAGYDGSNVTLEVFAVPTANTKFKCDAFTIPATADISLLPSYFRKLIRLCVLSEIPSSGITIVNVDYAVREAVAREEDMAGVAEYALRDDLQEARLADVNNPS